MRSQSRIIAAVLTVLALFAVALTSAGSATAASDVSAKARTAHVLKHYNAAEVRNSGKFYVKGQVVTFPNKIIKLDKRTCKKCKFKGYKSQRTNGTGGFRINFDGPVGTCYRIYVPGTSKYRPLYKSPLCIISA